MTEQEKALIKHAQKWIKEAEAARDEIPFGFDDDTEKELSLMKVALAALNTPTAPAIPDGWKLVPVEPTKEMRVASRRYAAKTKLTTGPGFYRAMIAAAPTP